MYILCSHFEPDLAVARVSELLALEGSPERLAEKLHIAADDTNLVNGIKPASFKRLQAEMEKIIQYHSLRKDIEKIRGGQSLGRFLGKGFQDKQVGKLEEEQRKLGSLLEAPRWFYRQERVWLLSAIRDYALDTSKNMEADWINTDDEVDSLTSPLVDMFSRGEGKLVKTIMTEMEKSLKDVDPLFVLQQLDGHRSLVFNFTNNLVSYFEPVREVHNG